MLYLLIYYLFLSIEWQIYNYRKNILRDMSFSFFWINIDNLLIYFWIYLYFFRREKEGEKKEYDKILFSNHRC